MTRLHNNSSIYAIAVFMNCDEACMATGESARNINLWMEWWKTWASRYIRWVRNKMLSKSNYVFMIWAHVKNNINNNVLLCYHIGIMLRIELLCQQNLFEWNLWWNTEFIVYISIFHSCFNFCLLVYKIIYIALKIRFCQ